MTRQAPVDYTMQGPSVIKKMVAEGHFRNGRDKHPKTRPAPDDYTKQGPSVIKKEGGRRPPSKSTAQAINDKTSNK